MYTPPVAIHGHLLWSAQVSERQMEAKRLTKGMLDMEAAEPEAVRTWRIPAAQSPRTRKRAEHAQPPPGYLAADNGCKTKLNW